MENDICTKYADELFSLGFSANYDVLKYKLRLMYREIEKGGRAEGQLETDVMPDWIPTKDRLPEREGRYLICTKDGNVTDAYFNLISFMQSSPGRSWEVKPIGWMNFPKPLRA